MQRHLREAQEHHASHVLAVALLLFKRLCQGIVKLIAVLPLLSVGIPGLILLILHLPCQESSGLAQNLWLALSPSECVCLNSVKDAGIDLAVSVVESQKEDPSRNAQSILLHQGIHKQQVFLSVAQCNAGID